MVKSKTLESNIVWHCNNSCVGCSHCSPVNPKRFVSIESLKQDCLNLAPVVHSELFVLLGGEPLLHPDLLPMAEILKTTGVSDGVAVLTNGNLLPQMGDDFWNTFDVVRISNYMGRITPEQMDIYRGKAKKLEVFDTTQFYKPFHSKEVSEKEAGQTYKNCYYKNQCWTVQDGYFFTCPQAWSYPRVLWGLPEEHDGIKIEGITEKAFSDFITKTVPFKACYRCQSYTVMMPWHQGPRETWIEDSQI